MRAITASLVVFRTHLMLRVYRKRHKHCRWCVRGSWDAPTHRTACSRAAGDPCSQGNTERLEPMATAGNCGTKTVGTRSKPRLNRSETSFEEVQIPLAHNE